MYRRHEKNDPFVEKMDRIIVTVSVLNAWQWTSNSHYISYTCWYKIKQAKSRPQDWSMLHPLIVQQSLLVKDSLFQFLNLLGNQKEAIPRYLKWKNRWMLPLLIEDNCNHSWRPVIFLWTSNRHWGLPHSFGHPLRRRFISLKFLLTTWTKIYIFFIN